MLLAALLAAAATVPVKANEPPCEAPQRFRLAYDVLATRSLLSLSGTSDIAFERRADAYSMTAETKASGWYSARQHSRGSLRDGVTLPHEYTQRATRRPLARTTFDWDAQRVTFDAGGTAPTAPRMQDRLSLLLELARRVRVQPDIDAVDIAVAGLRAPSVYRFRARGTETLDLPAGRYDTIKLERPLDADNDGLEVWIAPVACFLPVRLRHTDDKGQVIDETLRELRVE
jgi:hypothetical protein